MFGEALFYGSTTAEQIKDGQHLYRFFIYVKRSHNMKEEKKVLSEELKKKLKAFKGFSEERIN